MKKGLLIISMIILSINLSAQKVEVSTKGESAFKIPAEIYGQFAEHLGRCIYDGIWVGEGSNIPNVNGYRKDVLEAFKALKIPVLRWPGGCFADTYQWRDGVGPKDKRPQIKNVFWGGTMEDNSFGTAEFFNLCEMLGCKTYLSVNVGSGTVKDMNAWLEYITGTEKCPNVDMRKKDGREKPWKIDYLGIGNESWGCGGNMTPEFYANLYRQYSGYAHLYSNNQNPVRVISGANADDEHWTDVLMKNCWQNAEAISVHYYTLPTNDWSKHGPDRDFKEDEYISTLFYCLKMDELVANHLKIMDKYDKQKKVKLMVDEWGIWTDPEPGTIPGHLYQQNTMRDALVASLTFDIFNKYADRLGMCNIAQVVNVLQAMVLTKGDKMILTPTYHVFKMYNVYQDADYIPLSFSSPKYSFDGKTINAVSMTCSKKDGKVHISISNADPAKAQSISLDLNSLKLAKVVKQEILTSKSYGDFNSFEQPNTVNIAEFKGANIKKGVLTVELPKLSIVTLELE